MSKKIEMAHVVRAHMEVAGCPVLTSNQCYAIAMNLNCMIYPDVATTPPQPIYDEATERELLRQDWSRDATAALRRLSEAQASPEAAALVYGTGDAAAGQ